MAKFLKYEDFVDPSKKEKYDSITIFDVDDTLVITKSKIKVHDPKTEETFELTPAQFNEFDMKNHQTMDFSDFRNLEIWDFILVPLRHREPHAQYRAARGPVRAEDR